MNTRIIFPLIFAAVLFFAKTGAAAQEANSSGHQENISERIQLTIFQNKTILPNKVARSQMELDRYRNEIDNGTRQGVIGSSIGFVSNLAARSIVSIIEKSRAKRTVEWASPTTRDYFYKDISFLGPLDPSGMQFSGFSMSRTINTDNSENKADSIALYLQCSLPDSLIKSFIANSRFTLQLDTLIIDLSKVQAKYTAKKKISFEISITMTSTWLDENLAIHENQKLGEFRICLPDIKFDKNNPKVTYGKKDSNNLLSGFCFFIPRSYGAYVNGQQYKECWGKGEFDITINVVESTGRSGKRNSTAEFALEYFQSEFPSAIQGLATNDNIMGAKTVKIINSY